MVFVIAAVMAFLAVAQAEHLKMESMKVRDSFVKTRKADKHQQHELVFAVKQNGLAELEKMVHDISSPENAQYQKWLNYDQIGEFTRNVEGATAIKNWLTTHGIKTSWQSKQHHYLKASATVEEWELLLNADFHDFEDISANAKKKNYIRSQEYSIPAELQPHVSAVFNTVQVPPPLHKRVRTRSMKDGEPQAFKTNLRFNPAVASDMIDRIRTESTTTMVTPAFINNLYQIPAMTGTASYSQSVFETAEEYFSPNDLKQFQKTYGLTKQAAQDIGGYSTSSCSTSGSPNDCYEGNLDVQYIMGISQVTTSIYWYVDDSGSTDPFVAWITDVADSSDPPKSNSISWGADEFVSSCAGCAAVLLTFVSHFSLRALQ